METTAQSFVVFVPAHFLRVAEILSCSLVAAMLLVERRGRQQPIDPMRQIEIQTLLDSLPDAVAILDPSGKIVDANSAAEKLSGLTREQLAGMEINDFARHMNGEMAANVVPFQKPIAMRVLAGERVGEERRRVRHPKTGAEVDLLISAHPIRNNKGEIKGALMVARDVTELSQLQQRLADIERHQAIGHVAAGIAHDFNNTLQTISQAVAVLQMPPERSPEERKAFLEMIQNAVRRGAEVIARIRDYLRNGTASPSDVDVRAVLEEAIELTRPMWQARPVEVHSDLKPCRLVRANKADLLRIFTNLIINSLQAMPTGGQLALGCEDDRKAVHVWVRDTGQGILPELRKQVFNPYFTTKAGGTGLGLSGAQKIMLELGGEISFTSEPGRGTQFDLMFPKSGEVEKQKIA
jgi:PAS domain S-box-containing protein